MAERSPVLKLVPTTPEHLQAQAVEQGDSGSRIKSVLASSFSATENFLVRHRQSVALAFVLTPAAIFSVDCAGGDDGGQTFTGGQLTQTAEALDPVPTNTPVKIVEVPASTSTAAPKPTEVVPTPTPEARVLPVEQVQQVVEKAITSGGMAADKGEILREVLSLTIAKTAKLKTDSSLWVQTLNDWGGAGEILVNAACVNKESLEIKGALLAVIAFQKDLWAKGRDQLGPTVIPADSWGVVYRTNYKSPQVRANCTLPYLSQFDPDQVK